jgi:Fic family protein
MDLFTPLLLLSIVAAVAHATFGVLGFIGGWYAVISFFFVLILLQRRAVAAAEEQEALYRNVSEWVVAEHNKLYENKVGTTGAREFANYASLFTREANLEDDTKLDELTRKKEKLVSLRPFDHETVSNITKALGEDMTFNSNAIEGNKITARETTIILAGLMVPRFQKNVTQAEFYQIIGHDKALKEIARMVKTDEQLTVKHILTLHKMVLQESSDGGILRSGEELALINRVKVLFGPPLAVEDLVKQFLEWLAKSNTMHPFLLAVTCHSIFVRIHPFKDGNGRMARLLMNFVLLRAHYPYLIVLNKKRDQYLDAVMQWQDGDPQQLTNFMFKMLYASFDKYFTALGVTLDSPPSSPSRLKTE